MTTPQGNVNGTGTQYNAGNFPYPLQNLGPMSGTPEEIYERAQTLVNIFSVLCDLEDLDLRSDQYGHTDCATYVAANFADPEAYLTVEHEISHIFFNSDLALGEKFRNLIIEEMMNKAGFKITAPEMQPYKQALERFIHHAWNCLEDHRVRSLWEEIFPGGGYFLEERWKNIAEHCLEDAAKSSMLGYMARTAAINADTPTAPPQFRQCVAMIKKAKSAVALTCNKTCLAITKQLIEQITDVLHNWAKSNNLPANPNPNNTNSYAEDLLSHAKKVGMVAPHETDLSSALPKRVDALSKIVQLTGAVNEENMGTGSGDIEVGAGGPMHNPMGGKDIAPKPDKKQNRNTRVNASDVRRIKQISKMASKANQGDAKAKSELDKLIRKGIEEMKKKIQKAKSELGKCKKEDDNESDKIEYLTAAKAAGITATIIDKPLPLPKPTFGAYRIQQELERIKMQRKAKLYEEGDELDIEAYIEAVLNDDLAEAKLFKKTTKESGLELLVLTDCSGSMRGQGIEMVDQAMADIEEAVKNIKVKTHLWGFSNWLYVFTKKGSMENIGGGGTDLNPALDTALEWARQSKSSRGIILLTDGYPTSCRQRNSTGNPTQDMANILSEAKNEGIVISILCINEYLSEYIHCSQCDGYGDYAYPSQDGTCPNCNATLSYKSAANTRYDSYFGKGNYALVTSRKEIAKQLPVAARALVVNHMNKHY